MSEHDIEAPAFIIAMCFFACGAILILAWCFGG